jgi:hypothetical protein
VGDALHRVPIAREDIGDERAHIVAGVWAEKEAADYAEAIPGRRPLTAVLGENAAKVAGRAARSALVGAGSYPASSPHRYHIEPGRVATTTWWPRAARPPANCTSCTAAPMK